MQAHNKFEKNLSKLILVLAFMPLAACGVKGPPEPPMPNEASVKKTESSPSETAEPRTPVIFPKKDTDKDTTKKAEPKKQGQ